MKELISWLSLARSPDSAVVSNDVSAACSTTCTSGSAGGRGFAASSNASTAGGKHYHQHHDGKRRDPPAMSAGIYYKLEAEFKQRHSGHHGSSHGSFRAKVQAISRIKMRLRSRAAFSATRWEVKALFIRLGYVRLRLDEKWKNLCVKLNTFVRIVLNFYIFLSNFSIVLFRMILKSLLLLIWMWEFRRVLW